MTVEPQIGVIGSRSDPSWHHRIARFRPLTGRRGSVCYILGVQTLLSSLEIVYLCVFRKRHYMLLVLPSGVGVYLTGEGEYPKQVVNV